jgi:hypothetical protein
MTQQLQRCNNNKDMTTNDATMRRRSNSNDDNDATTAMTMQQRRYTAHSDKNINNGVGADVGSVVIRAEIMVVLTNQKITKQ